MIMENKINIAELLEGCPRGMELYSPIFGEVYLDKIIPHLAIVVTTKVPGDFKEEFLYDGRYGMNGECMLFPSKGKTTWEGFIPPRKFKDGDVLYIRTAYRWICIYKEGGEKENVYHRYVAISASTFVHDDSPLCHRNIIKEIRLATEEEKEKLFKAIKDNGYKWNAETKTLEKITRPNFKVGDWVTDGVRKFQIHFITDTHYWYSENCILGSIESVDKQYHLWTINDAKDGDVLFHSDSASSGIFIFKEILQLGTIEKVVCHCDYDSEDGFCLGENHTCCWTDSKILYPATKKRCDLLFQKIKEAGYKWNPETKVLEKIEPSFKVGDIVKSKNCPTAGSFVIVGIGEDSYSINLKNYCIKFKDQDNYELLNGPKFKVGNNIRLKGTSAIYVVTEIREDRYMLDDKDISLRFKTQDQWELAPNKFDITTLIPFESRVLVRDTDREPWKPDFFGCLCSNDDCPYMVVGGIRWKCCIPYEGNEHLLDKTDDCDEFYKTWE